MFGAKKGRAQNSPYNVILLDIESSSVGAALAHMSPGQAPILFAEQRVALAVPQTLNSAGIAKQLERAARGALEKVAHVAARFRGNASTQHKGEFTHAAAFLGAPWGVPNLAAGSPSFSPHIQKFIAGEMSAFAPDVPLAFYTNADAAAYGSKLRGNSGITLLALVRGEVTELILMGENDETGKSGALGYATVPVGSRSLYRTLQSHAGLSFAEMPAVLALANSSSEGTLYQEPLDVAGQHMIEQFAPGLEALAHGGTPSGVVVVAEEPIATWVARALEADTSLGSLFSPNATVRTLHAKHAAQHLGGHGPQTDLHLSLAALFAQAKMA